MPQARAPLCLIIKACVRPIPPIGDDEMRRTKLRQALYWCAALSASMSVSALAFAADLPIRKPLYPTFTWTGWYGGVNVGYAWGDPQIASVVTSIIDPGPAATGVVRSQAFGASGSAHSVLGGLQGGFNFQSGPWVYGLETDLQVVRLQAAAPTLTASTRVFGGADTASLQTSSNASASIDWFGTLRARLGLAWGKVLVYGTGGFSYGLVRLTDGASFSGYAGDGNAPPNASVAFNNAPAPKNSLLKAGWSAGGGIDYAYTTNLILSLTYMHVDLGSLSEFSNYRRPNNILGGTGLTAVRGWTFTDTNLSFDVVRVAASWKL